jgi:hypothetical protein
MLASSGKMWRHYVSIELQQENMSEIIFRLLGQCHGKESIENRALGGSTYPG